MEIGGESSLTPADLETAVWRASIGTKLDALAAAVEKYTTSTNGTLDEHSTRLDAFGLALARQIAINEEVGRLRDENRVINVLLAAATVLGAWFGIRFGE